MAGSATSEDGDLGFQIAPMVDVVFVLLLFFMAMAGSQIKEKELPCPLPGSGLSPTIKVPIVIDIAEDSQVSMNGKVYATSTDKELLSLRDWLKAAVEQFGRSNPVTIRPQPGTRHERIVGVLGVLGAEHLQNLTFN